MHSDQSRASSSSTSDTDSVDPGHWLDAHGDVLYRFAMQRVRDETVVEELIQETLLAGIRNIATFEGKSTVRTWLTAILRRKVIDHYRQAHRERSTRGTGVDALETIGPDFDEKGIWTVTVGHWPSGRLSPEELADLRRAIDQCASDLPPSLASVFALREIEHMDSENICEVLSISPTNLWTRLHRMRIMLRRCLEQRWLGVAPGESEP